MSAVPYGILAQVKNSLVELYLSNNVYVELGADSLHGHHGADTFPPMGLLRVLTLEECRVQNIHPDAFRNLPALETLRLDGNLLYTVPEAAILPSLRTLSFRGIPEMFLDGQKFVLPDMFYNRRSIPMANLRSLAFVDCSLGAIRASKFKGLEGLQEMVRMFANSHPKSK